MIIVGAGTAGLMLADGIAERADVTLVEGGIDPGSPAPPELLYDYIFPASLDWGYRSTAGVPLPRGKVIGGCSTVNSSAGVRGQQWDFDPWGEGWTWADCLPAFKANETDEQFGDADYHGDSGPIVMTRLSQGAIDDAFTAACLAAGHPSAPDHNAPGALGIGPWPTNRVDEGRWGTLAGVMPGLRGRVTLLAETTARRVVITDGRARGVEVTGPDGANRVLDADVVVLAAGAFGTPELLVASGVDLPGVGEHLQDHPWVMLNVTADPEVIAARP
ncbi:GMC family oxidoreductase N-terminal domain-containing protein, partial [Frankia sp. EI5c]|uniref:GMC family oxidoreductase N-terminal domain-containing protein n=1 Tax=Frankia sp. EI5c TaxID=683316 RepID=UPI0037C08DB9